MRENALTLQTTDEELAELARSGDERAATELFDRYVPMIEGAARRTRVESMEYEDLLNEGRIALRTAIKTFKPGRWWFVKWAELLVDRQMTNAWRRRPKLKLVTFDGDGNGAGALRQQLRSTSETSGGDAQDAVDAAAADDLKAFGKGNGSPEAELVFARYRAWKGAPESPQLEAIDVFLLSRRYLRSRMSGTEARDVAPAVGIPRDLARALAAFWAESAIAAGLRAAA